jgi:hypothetical protein
MPIQLYLWAGASSGPQLQTYQIRTIGWPILLSSRPSYPRASTWPIPNCPFKRCGQAICPRQIPDNPGFLLPRNCPNDSLNSQINGRDFTCKWGFFTDIVAAIVAVPPGSLGVMFDVDTAYSQMPVHPDDQLTLWSVGMANYGSTTMCLLGQLAVTASLAAVETLPRSFTLGKCSAWSSNGWTTSCSSHTRLASTHPVSHTPLVTLNPYMSWHGGLAGHGKQPRRPHLHLFSLTFVSHGISQPVQYPFQR